MAWRPLAAIALLVLGWTAAMLRAHVPDPAAQLTILPNEIVLRGHGSRQQLLVEARSGNVYVGDRTGECTFTSSNPNVASVDRDGLVAAVADGRAIVAARCGERGASTIVQVERAFAPYPTTFRNHVMSWASVQAVGGTSLAPRNAPTGVAPTDTCAVE